MGRRGPAKTPGSKRWVDNPTPSTVVPAPPYPLDGLPLSYYERLGEILVSRGRMAAEYNYAMWDFATTLDRKYRAWELEQKEGLLLGNEKQTFQHPAIKIQNDCAAKLVVYYRLFGLSPADMASFEPNEPKENLGKEKFFKTVG